MSGMQSMGGDEPIGMTEMEQFAANPALQQALKIVGILALCVAGFFLMRALSKHAQRGAEAERREERERLPADSYYAEDPERPFSGAAIPYGACAGSTRGSCGAPRAAAFC